MDLYRQLLRAEDRTNHFCNIGDQRMFMFWSRIYYYLRRKVATQDRWE
jgi:hypothetical protein